MKPFTWPCRGVAASLPSSLGASFFAAALCVLPVSAAHAQTAHFAGAQSSLIPGLKSPEAVAVDVAGNIYISDSGNHRVLKETAGVNGFIETVVTSSIASPGPIAVDTAGNVYVADFNNNRVLKETPAGGAYSETVAVKNVTYVTGVAVDNAGNLYVSSNTTASILKETLFGTTYIQSTVCGDVLNPEGLAVDAAGNVYIADGQNNRVLKETASSGGYTRTVIGSGMNWPYGVAIDAAGNVFVADTGHARILKETLSSGAYTQSVVQVATTLNDPQAPANGPGGVAVDARGNLYIADSVNSKILRISQSIADFGLQTAGAASQPITLMFDFDVAGTLGAVSSLTQGVAGLDFAAAPGASCAAGGFFFTGAFCTVDINFTPHYAGDRGGAFVLRNSNSHAIATAWLHGEGVAAQVNYLPATQKTVSYSTSGQTSPYGVAVDGNGFIYIADADNNRVLKEAATRGGYIETVIGSGLLSPAAVAVDAAGDVFIADTQNNRVVKETPYGHGYTQSVLTTGLASPYGVAVGPEGSVYISDTQHSRVLRERPAGAGYTQSVVPFSGLGSPYGLAVDGGGAVYVGDVANGGVLKATPSGSSYVQSSVHGNIPGPYGVAVDAMGTVYITVFNGATVYKYRVSGTGYIGSKVGMSGVENPYAVAVDARGNVFIADVGNQLLYEEDLADAPSLNFANTPVGAISSDSPQAVTISNFGNLPLSISVPMTGSNPSVAANFDLNAGFGSSCPQVMPAGNPAALGVGMTCLLHISFNPQAAGALSGSIVLTDDALNPAAAGGSMQTIALAGNASLVPTTITWAAPVPIIYGTPLGATQLNAAAMAGTVPVDGTYVYNPAAGKILTPGTTPLSVAFTPTNAAQYVSSSANTSITVQKAVLKVTPIHVSKVYGSANPTFTYTITGFVNGDTAATAVTGKPLLSTSAVTGSAAGTYPIIVAAGTLASAKYTFQLVAGTLTVSRAPLSVSATDATVVYNKALPVFAYTVTGFVNGDTKTVLFGAPVESTIAVVGSAPGTYPINLTQGTLAAANYSFTFINGTLTVTPLGTVATPTFTPGAGTYAVAQNVTIADTTAGAAIYYTTNGTAPTAASTKYTVAIKVTATETIKAIAVAPGYTQSAVASALFTIN